MSNFYRFDQNNSGGHFQLNNKLSHNIYVEADDVKEANNFAVAVLGIYFDGVREGKDCGCCGDRWHKVREDVDYTGVGFETIEDYVQDFVNSCGYKLGGYPDSRIFFKDGTVKEFYNNEGLKLSYTEIPSYETTLDSKH